MLEGSVFWCHTYPPWWGTGVGHVGWDEPFREDTHR